VRWGAAGEQKMVKVYSNCPEVELFLNGKSLGKRKRNSQDFPAAGLRWMTPFREGENELRAVGEKDGAVVTDRITFRYQTAKWDKPARLRLETVKVDGDVATVEARLLDAKGVACLDARNTVRFGVTGDGRLIDNQGTARGSRVVQLANGRAQISVRLHNGESVVSVSSAGLPTAIVPVKAGRRPGGKLASRG
jgi:beta-galactosidase